MMKCFDAIKQLDFSSDHPQSPAPNDEDSIDIYGMVSSENEYVSLGANLKARNEVEIWLAEVEKFMVKQLRFLCKEAIDDFESQVQHEWVFDLRSC